MEMIGTIIILLVFVCSGMYFSHKKKGKTAQTEQENQLFFEQLDRQMNEDTHRKSVVIYAGGDANSEIEVCDVIKELSMPEDKRIKYE